MGQDDAGEGGVREPEPRPHRHVGPLIAIASPDESVRRWWARGLGDATVVQEFGDLASLQQGLTSLRPSMLLLDLALPRLGGTRGVARLVKLNPATKVVALADGLPEREAVALLKSGGHGYSGRDIAPTLIRKMVEAVQKGELWVPRRVMLALLRELIPEPRRAPSGVRSLDARLRPLTPREREIAYLVSAGAKNKDIASSLDITETTVKAHLTAIFRKLGVPDRLRLALMITEGDRAEPERASRSKSSRR